MKRNRAAMTTAVVAVMLLSGTARALPLAQTAEDALAMAAELANDGHFEDADALLARLAQGDPTKIDMRTVDRIAAKIAYGRGDIPRALGLLSAVVQSDPENWRARYDLAHVAMGAKKDRLAKRHLRLLLKQPLDEAVHRKVAKDLRILSERQSVHVSMRAAAAPSTNINSATRAETFLFAGVLPFELSDDARAQSGIGVNWSANGAWTPPLGDGLRGHLAISGVVTDHSNRAFDQDTVGLEAGVRHQLRRANGLDTSLLATHTRRTIAGGTYQLATGGRFSVRSLIASHTSASMSLSVEQTDYPTRPDRNGHITAISGGLQSILTPRLRGQIGISLAREAAQAATESNLQTAIHTGLSWLGPWGWQLGAQPAVYFRDYDALAAAYGTRRQDVTADVALSVGHSRLIIGGFAPAFIYRYTNNASTVDLFSYDRHGVDIAFSRAF